MEPSYEEVEIEKASLARFDHLGYGRAINPERWVRARNEILFLDVVEDLLGHRSGMISCPFHGTDSTPSFKIYSQARGNCGFCFGCPPGHGVYDSIRFVSEYLGISRVKALQWLEKKWSLPDLPFSEPSKDILSVSLGFEDLKDAFLSLARNDTRESGDPNVALEYLSIYFQAERMAKSDDEEQQHNAAVMLAQILPEEKVASFLNAKKYKAAHAFAQ